METLIQKISKKAIRSLWLTLFYLCVASAVVLSGLRIIMPYAERYLASVETMIQAETGLEVHIASMDSGWQGFGPALRLEHVELSKPDTHEKVISFNNVDIQLDLIRSLLKLSLIPGRLTLDGMDLVLEQAKDQPEDKLKVENFIGPMRPKTMADEFKGEFLKENRAMLLLASRFGRLDIRDSNVKIVLTKGAPVTINIPRLELKSSYTGYHFETSLYRTDMKGKITILADINGNVEAPESLEVDGFISLDQVAFDSRWMPSQFDNVKVKSGAVNMGLWFNWHDYQWHKVMGKFDIKNLALQNKQIDTIQLPLNLSGDVAWERAGGDFWRLSGDNIVLKLGERGSPAAAFLLQGAPYDPWELKVDKIAVNDLVDIYLLDKVVTKELEDWIEHLNPDAIISQLQFKWMPTNEGMKQWQVGFQLQQWSNSAYKAIPAVTGLNAFVKFDDKFGQVDIDTKNLILGLHNQYATPVQMDELKGTLHWQNENGFLLHAPHIELTYKDFDMVVSLNFKKAEKLQDSILQIQAKTGPFDHVTAQELIPLDVVPAGVVSWIHGAVEKGTVNDMTLVVDGPIGKMPFKHNEGKFEIRIGLSDFDIDYKPGWPKLTETSGELVIDGNEFKAFVDHGFVYHSALNQTVVTIPFVDKSKPTLMTIQGNVQGPAEDGKNYVLNSPLKENLGNIFTMVDITGELSLDLKLGIYLHDQTHKDTVNGVATLKNASLDVEKWRLALKDLNGSMSFSDHDYSAKSISAMVFGFPSQLSIKSNKTDHGYRMDWRLSSRFTDKSLNEFIPSDIWSLFSGQSNYGLEFSTHIPAKSDRSQLGLVTNWEGMAIMAPAPLGKTAKQSIPTYVGIPMDDTAPMLISLRYGTLMSALLELKKDAKGYDVSRIQVAMGDTLPPNIAIEHGIHISGDTPSIKVDDWIAFIEDYQKKHKSQGGNFPFTTDVVINKLMYHDAAIDNARTRLSRGDREWHVILDAKQMNGSITVPDKPTAQKPMLFALSRCNWTLKHDPDSKSTLNMRSIPPINFNCADTILNDHPFGRVEVVVRPQADGVLFDPIQMTGDKDRLNAHMSWLEKNKIQTTSIVGNIKSDDIHGSLAVWGINSDVRDAEGDFKFDLKWPGGPSNFKTANLSGSLDAKMSKGRFVGVDPGVGRLLGLLSLQSIGRRLKLDFSDVFQKGFAFDSVDSRIKIANGFAVTDKTDIKAPAANINMTGKAGLVDKSLDLDMYVHANVDGTVPILGAAVAIASPVAGAAVWVADKVFNPLANLSEHHYHISGTWKDPIYDDRSKEYQLKLKQKAPVEEAQPD